VSPAIQLLPCFHCVVRIASDQFFRDVVTNIYGAMSTTKHRRWTRKKAALVRRFLLLSLLSLFGYNRFVLRLAVVNITTASAGQGANGCAFLAAD